MTRQQLCENFQNRNLQGRFDVVLSQSLFLYGKHYTDLAVPSLNLTIYQSLRVSYLDIC